MHGFVQHEKKTLVLYCSFTNSRRSSAHINVTLGCAHVTTGAVEKQAVLCILTFEIVALVIQHVKRKSLIIVPSVACLKIACFYTLFHERQYFRKYIVENKICALVFSTILSESFLILRRIRRDIFINVYRASCNITRYYCQILMTLQFCGQSLEKYPMPNFIKNRPVADELFHAHG